MSIMHSYSPRLQGPEAESEERLRQIDSAAWAFFFIWIGVTMLAAVPWGWFLVGIGVLVIGTQVARWQIGLNANSFGIASAWCSWQAVLGSFWHYHSRSRRYCSFCLA